MNSLSFNQDFSCLSVSTNKNHRIFNCDPFGEFYTSSRKPSVSSSEASNLDDSYSGTFLLKMLFSTSLTIIVPAAENGNHRVLKIFNLKQNLKICELTFASAILDVMLNRKRLVVFLEIGQIYIYDLSSVRLIKVLETENFAKHDKHANHVTVDLSSDDASFLVLPLSVVNESTDLLNTESAAAVSAGDFSETDAASANPSHTSPSKSNITSAQSDGLVTYVELTRKNEKTQFRTLHELHKDSPGWVVVYDTISLKPRLIYKAHDSAIAKIALSSDSRYIATASEKGTIVRVSHLENPEDIHTNESPSDVRGKLSISQVTNLRRGHNPAKINALRFNLESTILGCGSESGTVHLFSMKGPAKQDDLHANSVDFDDSHDANEASFSEDEPSRLSSSEDLNENLANLLISKNVDEPAPKPSQNTESRTYFAALKSSAKFINNPYTKSIVRRLPYRKYIKNLIWEKPRRSFAYVRVPESDAGNSLSSDVEIGFSTAGNLMLASYSGVLYQYRFPAEVREERAECELVSQNSLI